MKVKNEEANERPMIGDRRSTLTKCEAHCDRFIDMMTEFERMRDGQLGYISVTKHHVGITSEEIQLVFCEPYRVAPTARVSEKERSIGS